MEEYTRAVSSLSIWSGKRDVTLDKNTFSLDLYLIEKSHEQAPLFDKNGNIRPEIKYVKSHATLEFDKANTNMLMVRDSMRSGNRWSRAIWRGQMKSHLQKDCLEFRGRFTVSDTGVSSCLDYEIHSMKVPRSTEKAGLASRDLELDAIIKDIDRLGNSIERTGKQMLSDMKR